MCHDLVDEFERFQLELCISTKRYFQAMDAHVAERLDGAEAAILIDRFSQFAVQSAAIRIIIIESWRWRYRLGHEFTEFVKGGAFRQGGIRIIDNGLEDVLPVVGETSCNERLSKRDIAAEVSSGAAVDGMAVFVIEITTIADDHDFEFDFDILQMINHEFCLTESHFAGDDNAADVELLTEETDGFGGKATDTCAEVDGLVDAPRLEAEHDGWIRHDVSIRIELLHGLHGGAQVGKPFRAIVMGVDREIEPAAIVMDGIRYFPQFGDLQEIVAVAKRPTVWTYLPSIFGKPVPWDETRKELLGSVLHVLLDPVGRVIRV